MSQEQQTQARVAQSEERGEHLKHLREQATIDEVFERSDVKFKIPNAEVLRSLGTLEFDADGIPHAGGVTLSAALKTYSEINPQAVAQSWQEHTEPESQIKSKGDLKTVKDKVAYIEKFGELAYARLPQTTAQTQQVPIEQLTWEQYKALPLRERARLAGERPGLAAQLQRKAQEQDRYDRLTGVPAGKRNR